MHFYFFIRGIISHTEIFKMFMQTQMFIWKRINLKTKKEEIIQVQGALRECPFGLWEYVFPEECLDEVLTMLGLPEDMNVEWGLSKFKQALIRKAIGNGVEPVPHYKKVPTNKYIMTKGIVIYPIGIKKDIKKDWKDIGYFQEML